MKRIAGSSVLRYVACCQTITLKAGTTIKAWAGPGRGTRDIAAEQFTSYIATPPHPDYVSGHSTFSGAAARILRLFTGTDTLQMSATIAKG